MVEESGSVLCWQIQINFECGGQEYDAQHIMWFQETAAMPLQHLHDSLHQGGCRSQQRDE